MIEENSNLDNGVNKSNL